MEKSKKIYLDNASATPIEGKVSLVMAKVLKEDFANPSAIHELGLKAKNKIEKARGEIAEILGAHKDEIVFTSGATESNNLAILGITRKYFDFFYPRGSHPVLGEGRSGEKKQDTFLLPHIITTNIEHASVLETCKYLEKNKLAEVTYVPVEENGIVDPKKIKKAIKGNTILVSVMYANNEIGTIQPINEIAKEIRHFRKNGNNSILEHGYFSAEKFLVLAPSRSQVSKIPLFPFFHTDATQAINYLPIKVEKLGVDLMSFNGGKIYGPKGVGALFVKRKTPVDKILFGGEQELGLRPGTENVASVVGLAEALKITEKIKEKENKRLIILRDYFVKQLLKLDLKIKINGDLEKRLPNNINITIPKIPSDLLVLELSAKGIYISEKSACKSGEKAESHVVKAICPRGKNFNNSLRFSLGRQTTKADLDHVLKNLAQILQKLKKWYSR